MCGIAGIFEFDAIAPSSDLLTAMTSCSRIADLTEVVT